MKKTQDKKGGGSLNGENLLRMTMTIVTCQQSLKNY